MKAVKEYIKATDRLFILLCVACSGGGVGGAGGVTSFAHDAASAEQQLFCKLPAADRAGGAAALGLACAIVISTFDYHTLATAWPIHAAVTWGMVLLTFVIGYSPLNTSNKSWIELPLGLSIQPTELAKISFILTFAMHLDNSRSGWRSPPTLMALLAHLGAPLLLIHLQGDDGTALIFLLIGLSMLFVAGCPQVHLRGVGCAAVVAPVLWFRILEDYQKERIYALFDPESYPDVMWQQNQASISIGRGADHRAGLFRGGAPHGPQGGERLHLLLHLGIDGVHRSLLVLALLFGSRPS